MASDLPNRPPADQSKKSAPIKDTDRVKAATDKPDPRFEAARQKAAKEDALRAKATSAKAESDAKDDAAPEAEAEAPKPKSSFSFSNTDEDEK